MKDWKQEYGDRPAETAEHLRVYARTLMRTADFLLEVADRVAAAVVVHEPPAPPLAEPPRSGTGRPPEPWEPHEFRESDDHPSFCRICGRSVSHDNHRAPVKAP